MIEIIIWFVVTFILAFIIGLYVAHRKNRVQCTNCGGHNTYLGAASWGGCGGEYEYVVKETEQHVCKDCDKITYVSMKLIK
tara:strand:+ start:13907 stop:14149 length:243 start_codon:yes stop_codon:yes gene_type:complete